MNNIVLILLFGLLISGLTVLLDIFVFAPRRKKSGAPSSPAIDCIKSFFPVLFAVLLIRSFLLQPYRVPTGSLEPTIMPGDFILVSQFAYGLRLPILNKKIIEVGEPKRGDISLFQFPENKSVVYVKRIIGLPGDHIFYRHKKLYINGEPVLQSPVLQSNVNNKSDIMGAEIKKTEDFFGVSHEILITPNKNKTQDFYLVVPDGQYFVMGDNRDNSYDSRYWGCVPEENLIGRAMFIWFSWNKGICWGRIGKVLH